MIGMGVGRVIRERVIPESWNRRMGDILYSVTESLHGTGVAEAVGKRICPEFLCGR